MTMSYPLLVFRCRIHSYIQHKEDFRRKRKFDVILFLIYDGSLSLEKQRGTSYLFLAAQVERRARSWWTDAALKLALYVIYPD